MNKSGLEQKIKDEAREAIKKILWEYDIDRKSNVNDKADQILKLSGETDEVCDDCKGTRKGKYYFNLNADCETCKGTGHKLWHIKVEVEE